MTETSGGISRVSVVFSAGDAVSARTAAIEYLDRLFGMEDEDYDIVDEDVHQGRGVASFLWEAILTAEIHIPE